MAIAIATVASAARAEPPVRIAALAPADDVRKSVVIGQAGEVYEPDGRGRWVHKLACSTATPVAAAGRAGGAVVALGQGVVYRLAGNGWSALRLVQRGKAILGAGARSLAAVGRQLFALDGLTAGEPTKLAVAPANIVAIGAGAKGVVIATETGVFRLAGGKLVAVKNAPRNARLISDRWAIVDRTALDLATQKSTALPGDLAIAVAAAAPDDALVAVGAGRAGLELVTLRAGKLARDPLGLTGAAVGVAVDRAGRAIVALSDGRIALRDKAGWTTTEVADEPADERPGTAPATSN